MSVRSRELRQEAGQLVTEARAILERAQTENRSMTAEEQTDFDAKHDGADTRLAEADRLERQERADAGLENRQDRFDPRAAQGGQRPVRAGGRFATDEYADHCANYLRNGQINNALQVDSDTGGGMIVASERLISGILMAVDDACPIRQYATVYPCSYEETLGAPSLDGDVSEFAFAGENTDAAEDDGLGFGKRELKPKALQRKIIPVSRRLLESPRLNTEQIVIDRVSVALGYTQERAYMNGNGANAPLGMFVASEDGISVSRDVISGHNTDYTGDGLINAQGALKAPYQNNARFLLHRDSITHIRKLKDGNGVYIWQPGLQQNVPNLILGKPYVTSEFAPNTFTQNSYIAIYGDFRYYWIADAISMVIQRLVEQPYAGKGQVGLMFDKMAVDGMPVMGEAFVRIKLSAA